MDGADVYIGGLRVQSREKAESMRSTNTERLMTKSRSERVVSTNRLLGNDGGRMNANMARCDSMNANITRGISVNSTPRSKRSGLVNDFNRVMQSSRKMEPPSSFMTMDSVGSMRNVMPPQRGRSDRTENTESDRGDKAGFGTCSPQLAWMLAGFFFSIVVVLLSLGYVWQGKGYLTIPGPSKPSNPELEFQPSTMPSLLNISVVPTYAPQQIQHLGESGTENMNVETSYSPKHQNQSFLEFTHGNKNDYVHEQRIREALFTEIPKHLVINDPALSFLSHDDPLHLHRDSPHLLQRYLFIVIHFAFFSSRPSDSHDYDMNRHQCEWDGVTCDDNQEVLGIVWKDKGLIGVIPEEIFALNTLVWLDLSSNQLVGTISSNVSFLSNLEELWLNNNDLKGTIPLSITKLLQMRIMSLSENSLHGSIPENINNLVRLEQLWLVNNLLSGTIPDSIGSLTNLEYLEVADNSLTGSIPKQVGLIDQLRVLNLAGNELRGLLPNSLYKLKQLDELWLSYNFFHGELSNKLGLLINLEILCVDHNSFDGPLPWNLGNLRNLKLLSITNNDFTGEVPSELCDIKPEHVWADCEKVECQCCTFCSQSDIASTFRNGN